MKIREACRVVGVLTMLGGLTAWAASDADENVPEAEVPRPVLQAVSKRYPVATARSFHKEQKSGRPQYEVEVTLDENGGTRKFTLEVSPVGEILSEEALITFDELPSAVKDAVRTSRYGKNAVERVERETKNRKTTYEIVVAVTRGTRELVYDTDGTLLLDKAEGREAAKR